MMQIQKKKSAKASAKDSAMKPVRLRLSTVKKLTKILETVNKKDFGKRVRPDAVADLASGGQSYGGVLTCKCSR